MSFDDCAVSMTVSEFLAQAQSSHDDEGGLTMTAPNRSTLSASALLLAWGLVVALGTLLSLRAPHPAPRLRDDVLAEKPHVSMRNQ